METGNPAKRRAAFSLSSVREQATAWGTKRRVILTRLGRVDVPLRRMRCEGCGQRSRPAEPCLEEIKGSNVTPERRELTALAGCSWPSESAAGVLKRLSGVQLSDERVQQRTNERGSVLAKPQLGEAKEALAEEGNRTHIREQRRENRPEEVAAWLPVGLDGGGIPSREHAGGRECNIGMIASPVDPVGTQGRHRLTPRKEVATCAGSEEIGTLRSAAACELKAMEAHQQVGWEDGADGIQTQREEHFPRAVDILDGPHLRRNIQAAIRALHPGKRSVRRAWRQEQEGVLFPLAHGMRNEMYLRGPWAWDHFSSCPAFRKAEVLPRSF